MLCPTSRTGRHHGGARAQVCFHGGRCRAQSGAGVREAKRLQVQGLPVDGAASPSRTGARERARRGCCCCLRGSARRRACGSMRWSYLRRYLRGDYSL